MTAILLEHDQYLFSKILLSREVSDILKQVIKESSTDNSQKCNYEKKQSIDKNTIRESQCSPNCWCKQEKSDEYLYL